MLQICVKTIYLYKYLAICIKLFINYSLLRAITGSFFAAIFEGINPAAMVSSALMRIRITAPDTGRAARPDTPERVLITAFIGMINSKVIPMPISPAVNPTMIVSALKTREISLLEAPILRKIPISFVLSNTEI